MTITSPKIWEAVKKDTKFMQQGFKYEKTAKILQDYIENSLLIVVDDMVNKPATIANIINVKIASSKHALSSDLFSKIIKSTHEEALGIFSSIGMLKIIVNRLGQIVEMLKPIAKNVPKFLKENDVSEELVYRRMELNPENIKKAMSGKLTIGDILVSQPVVILGEILFSQPAFMLRTNDND